MFLSCTVSMMYSLVEKKVGANVREYIKMTNVNINLSKLIFVGSKQGDGLVIAGEQI